MQPSSTMHRNSSSVAESFNDALHQQADALSPPDDESGGPNYARATVMHSAADQLFFGGLYARRRYHAEYVAYFCEKSDVLSQWQRYGGPGGYAVGFRSFEIGLERPAGSNHPDCFTLREQRAIRAGPSFA